MQEVVVRHMQQIHSLTRSLRTFWTSAHQRRRVVWVLAAIAVAVMAVGAYLIISGQREYARLSDKLDDIETRRAAFDQLFPLTEVDGEMVPDLSEASQSDLMFIAMLRRDENIAQREQIDADNERRQGVRFIGYGVIVLALAYFFKPEYKGQPAPDTAEPGAPDESPPAPQL